MCPNSFSEHGQADHGKGRGIEYRNERGDRPRKAEIFFGSIYSVRGRGGVEDDCKKKVIRVGGVVFDGFEEHGPS